VLGCLPYVWQFVLNEVSVLDEHLGYVGDLVRRKQLECAISRVINLGDRVVDVGCGTGILGLLCLRAGASHVHAIDSTAILEVARGTFSRAGWSDRTSLIRAKSQDVKLAQRADVVVCDHVGYFGFDYGILEFLTDARRRFLKPGGRLIPSSVTLKLAPIESQACADMAVKWRGSAVPEDYHWVCHHSLNTKYAVRFKKSDVLGVPITLSQLSFYDDHPDFFTWDAELTMDRDGTLHGLGGWFDCELTDGVWMTNSPLSDQSIDRSQAFLPIAEAVAVQRGEKILVKVIARPSENLISWSVEFVASGRKFEHSTWQGTLLSAEDLARRSPRHVPVVSDKGKAKLIVLGYCDGRRTSQQVEHSVLSNHPDLFANVADARRFIAQTLAGETK
jgi:SAM-dependent methyltransferase